MLREKESEKGDADAGAWISRMGKGLAKKDRLRKKMRTPISEEAMHIKMQPQVGARKTGSVKKSIIRSR